MPMNELLTNARAAKGEVSRLTTARKNTALEAMADSLLACGPDILEANALDMEAARDAVSPVMLDRLLLTMPRVEAMAAGLRAVAALPDPVGRLLDSRTRADGLTIDKISVPMGVVAIIYESRPNVTADAAALALKSGNVCVLRGAKRPSAPPAPSWRPCARGLGMRE